MKKLSKVLCVAIIFLGIIGCLPSDDPTPKNTTSSVVTKSDVGGVFPIAEPSTLVLLGSGLVGISVLARKKFRK